MWKVLSVICIIFTPFVFCAKLPDSVQKCNHGQLDCIKIAINKIVHNVSQDFNLISLEPLPIKSVLMKPGPNSPVRIEVRIFDALLYGLQHFDIYNISGFTNDIKGYNEIHLKGSKLDLIGPYTINGQILIIPIQGTGPANVTLVNPDIHLRFSGKPVERDGKIYMQTDNLKMTFSITRLFMDLQNLYKGDKLLGETTNRFINEYWKDIYLELKPSINLTFQKVLQEAANTVFNQLPFDELYLK